MPIELHRQRWPAASVGAPLYGCSRTRARYRGSQRLPLGLGRISQARKICIRSKYRICKYLFLFGYSVDTYPSHIRAYMSVFSRFVATHTKLYIWRLSTASSYQVQIGSPIKRACATVLAELSLWLIRFFQLLPTVQYSAHSATHAVSRRCANLGTVRWTRWQHVRANLDPSIRVTADVRIASSIIQLQIQVTRSTGQVAVHASVRIY